MPRSKTNFHRRRFRRKPRRKPNIASIVTRPLANMTLRQAAYGAMKGVNMMKGIINSEKKRFDQSFTQSPSNTGFVLNINSVATGDDVNNRQGNSILAKYLTLNYTIQMSSSAGTTQIRLLIIVDTENQGSDPSLSTILQDSATTINLTSPINSDATQRFTIIKDIDHNLSINGTRGAIRKWFMPLNFHMRYTGTAGTTYNKNAMYLVGISNEPTNVPVVSGSTRLCFYDN